MQKIILATSSPYRQEAFRFLDLDFVAEDSAVDEKFEGRPDSPQELVLHLAKLKAEAVARNHSSGIVIGFDSVGWFDGKILEKPESKKEAVQRLKDLSGNSHQFFTGVFMKNLESGKEISKLVETETEIRNLSDAEIEKYLEQDPRFNTYALGYDPLGHFSSTFVRRINGSYNNILRGIPLEAIVEMLPEVGYEIIAKK